MITQKIVENIQTSLKELGVKDLNVQLERPANADFGDYSSNIALKLTQELKKSPMDIAQEIASHLPKDGIIEKVDVMKPGFINFWVSKKVLLNELKVIAEEKEHYGKTEVMKGRKISVEFTDPNPFKEFHIGHLYSNIVGEALCRIWEANGAEVRRVNYQGDVGLHVAKSLWGLQKKMVEDKLTLIDLDKKELNDKVKYLGKAYAYGATLYEEDKNAQEEMKVLNKKIYEKDPEIKELYESGRKWSLDYFESIYKRLGTQFKGYYFESAVGEVGLKIVKENLEKGVFEKSEGAVIFPGEKYGLHNRVFINSLGLPTYEAKELGLAPTKYKDWAYDESYIVTGNEINTYFKVLICAMKQIYPDLGNKTFHIGHGMVKLKEGKMSSRTGKIITGEWLLDTAKDKALLLSKDNTIAEAVAIGAIKYALLKQSIGRDVEFSFDESISFEGNAGPYLQYMYVRAQSVLKNGIPDIEKLNPDQHLEKEEMQLLRLLVQYKEVIQKAASSRSPHLIATYLYDLAKTFSYFYEKQKILVEDDMIKNTRMLLTISVTHVLKSGLHLLGINIVEKM